MMQLSEEWVTKSTRKNLRHQILIVEKLWNYCEMLTQYKQGVKDSIVQRMLLATRDYSGKQPERLFGDGEHVYNKG